jgi:hypothetical protein
MEKAFETELTGSDKAELKKLIEQFEEAMRRYDEQRIKDWEEIERLQADTRAKLEFLRKAA